MFVLICWILIVECAMEIQFVYGFPDERVVVSVPMHIKKMHHTKIIYKIVEKPVHPETGRPLGRIGGLRSQAMDGTDARGDDVRGCETGNGTVSYGAHTSREYVPTTAYRSMPRPDADGNHMTTGRGRGLGGEYVLDSESGGFGIEDRDLWHKLVRDARKHHRDANAVPRFRPVNVLEHVDEPHRHAPHPGRGHRVGDGRENGHVDERGRITDAVVRQIADTVIEHVTDPKHGHFVDVWPGRQISGTAADREKFAGLRFHGHYGHLWPDGHHEIVTDDMLKHVTKSVFEHVTNPKHGHFGDVWRGHGRPKAAVDLVARRGRRPDGGRYGYRVQENDDGNFDERVPAHVKAFLDAGHHGHRSVTATGHRNSLDGMASVSSVDSPRIHENVYYTLDPYVPYHPVGRPKGRV